MRATILESLSGATSLGNGYITNRISASVACNDSRENVNPAGIPAENDGCSQALDAGT
jgi:hypothetical protein